jgi:hypothetical protein
MVVDYVFGHNEPVANFVAQLIPHCRRGFGPNVMTLGVVEGGLLTASQTPISRLLRQGDGGVLVQH